MAEIPVEVRCSIDKCGGIPGLRKDLPNRGEITKVMRIGRGISDVTRLRVLCLLRAQPLCVCVIKSVLKISDSKLSYHLTILSEAGMVKKKRERKFNIYALTKIGRRVLKMVL